MASLLVLHVPVPSTFLAFEETFFGDRDALIHLSRLRRAAALAGGAAVLGPEHVETIVTYARAWRDFATTLTRAGSSARARLPLEFSWRVQWLTSSKPVTIVDTSPLLESVCTSLAVASAYQRRGAESPRGDELVLARDELTRLRALVATRIVEPPLPVARFAHDAAATSIDALRTAFERTTMLPTREPVVYSRTGIQALLHAVSGQAEVKTSLVHLASNGDARRMAVLLFRGAREFASAHALLPTEFERAHAVTTALALRYSAAALLDSATPNCGVALALARRAAATDPSNASIRRFVADTEERNRVEFGMHTVPETVLVALSPGSSVVTATETADGWRVDIGE